MLAWRLCIGPPLFIIWVLVAPPFERSSFFENWTGERLGIELAVPKTVRGGMVAAGWLLCEVHRGVPLLPDLLRDE